ncbi:hypothetical protein EGI32_10050 [Ferruginibacter sp. HRS2-29]|nr:hypothetical protein [Ferruginibacter sp. HRS2-29]
MYAIGNFKMDVAQQIKDQSYFSTVPVIVFFNAWHSVFKYQPCHSDFFLAAGTVSMKQCFETYKLKK